MSTTMRDPTKGPLRVVVMGAAGRMGRALISAIDQDPDATVHAAIEHEGSSALGADAGVLAGIGEIGVEVSDDALASVLQGEAVVDFTTPATTVAMSELTAQARIIHVIGTTGFAEEHEEAIQAAASHAVIVKSGNMSLGVNLLSALTEKVARALDADFDIEVLEMHHKHKVDAPSGTALLLGQAAADGRDISFKDNSVMVREGQTGARDRGSIGFATLRGGSVVGEHSVIFAGEGERIELSHKAGDRAIFARGALKAAHWGRGKKPGLYSMMDVLGLG